MTSEIESVDGVFELGDLPLESGALLRSAKIAYRTHGQLNADKTNAVLYPTQFGAQHNDVEWIIGRGRALDPSTHFIVVLDQLGTRDRLLDGRATDVSVGREPSRSRRAHRAVLRHGEDDAGQRGVSRQPRDRIDHGRRVARRRLRRAAGAGRSATP
jgi:hypothetical protein